MNRRPKNPNEPSSKRQKLENGSAAPVDAAPTEVGEWHKAGEMIADMRESVGPRDPSMKKPVFLKRSISDLDKKARSRARRVLKGKRTLADYAQQAVITREHVMARLGQDSIEEKHPLLELVGQRGLFARKAIRSRTYIGVYAGIWTTEVGAELARKRDPHIFLFEAALKGKGGESVRLWLDASGAFGNGWAELINDCRISITSRPSDPVNKDCRENCGLHVVRHRGYPHVVIEAVEDIAEGEELLFNYGTEYRSASE